MSAVIPWRVNYRAVFGDLSESRAAAWEDYILANCRKATSEDIDKAVAALCSGEQGEHKPGVRAILAAIWRGMGYKSEGKSVPALPHAWRRALEYFAGTRDIVHAWDCVCEAGAHSHRPEWWRSDATWREACAGYADRPLEWQAEAEAYLRLIWPDAPIEEAMRQSVTRWQEIVVRAFGGKGGAR